MAIVCGVVAGYASVLFRLMLHNSEHFFFDYLFYNLLNGRIFYLPLIPVLGVMFLLPFVLIFEDNRGGYAIPKFLVEVHLKRAYLKAKGILLRIICSSITIGSGGAAGVEGPSALIGGTVGSVLGHFFHMSHSRIIALIACGSAAGLAAQFNAPITGVLFAQEIIMMGRIGINVFGAVVISSGIATAISRASLPHEKLLGTLTFSYEMYELLFYALFGVFAGLMAAMFIKTFLRVQDVFTNLKLHFITKMFLGAFLVGLIGMIQQGAMGEGYLVIRQLIHFPQSIALLSILALPFLKMLATSITLGSGGFGGVFSPSLFIGGFLGASFASILLILFPYLDLDISNYAIIGMGAFLAAVTHAPLTSIFLLFEVSGHYEVIVPVMISSVIGTMVCRHFKKDSIDTADLARQGIHLHEGKEITILNSIKVSEVMDPNTDVLDENMTFSTLLKKIQYGRQQYYPVLDVDRCIRGIVSFQDVKEFMMEQGLEDLVLVSEIMVTDIITVKESDNISQAMEKFSYKDIDVLPVVDDVNPDKFLGMLRHRDIILAYNKKILMHKF